MALGLWQQAAQARAIILAVGLLHVQDHVVIRPDLGCSGERQ